MVPDAIDAVIDAQAELIAALDLGDVIAIEAATATLLQQLAGLRAADLGGAQANESIGYALKQTEAARIRINYLADRTRQRLDHLATRRGAKPSNLYTMTGRMAVFRA